MNDYETAMKRWQEDRYLWTIGQHPDQLDPELAEAVRGVRFEDWDACPVEEDFR